MTCITSKLTSPLLAASIFWLTACNDSNPTRHLDDLANRVNQRHFPSVFMAWNPIDMKDEFPLETLEQRLTAAAKHDLLWEEPISQLSFNTPLVLGLHWQHQHAGLASQFTPDSLAQALANRVRLLEKNPNMVMLMEVRWRDAPNSYLPEDSPFWQRDAKGQRVEGWDGGPEPYYMLNYTHPDFLKRIGEMSRLAVESGVYDGIMLDWSGHIEVVKAVRAAIDEKAVINVNLHDRIEDAEPFQQYINGSFMECNPGHSQLCSWSGMAKALDFFETKFREPRINGIEVWGDRSDLQRMRAATALALTKSNGYVLYGDTNKLPTPDHLHDWYSYWDINLGEPVSDAVQLENGALQRQYQKGVVVFSPEGTLPVKVHFDTVHLRVSDQSQGQNFELAPIDGDIFLPIEH